MSLHVGFFYIFPLPVSFLFIRTQIHTHLFCPVFLSPADTIEINIAFRQPTHRRHCISFHTFSIFFFCFILAMCIFINSFSSSLILCTLHLVYSMHYEHDPGYKRWIRMCMGWWARVVYFLNVALRAPHIAHATPRTISAPLKESIFLLLLFVVVVFCN